MLLFLVLFFCHASSPERRAFEGCIVRTRIALPIICRFRRGLDRFFQTRYIVLIDVRLYKNFSARRYMALMSNFASVVQRRLGMYKFVRTKSHTGSKFSKIFFEQLYTGSIVVVHVCFDFSLWRQMAPQQSAKFRTAFFGQFRTSLRKDSIANYASIWTLFTTSVTGPDVLLKH